MRQSETDMIPVLNPPPLPFAYRSTVPSSHLRYDSFHWSEAKDVDFNQCDQSIRIRLSAPLISASVET